MIEACQIHDVSLSFLISFAQPAAYYCVSRGQHLSKLHFDNTTFCSPIQFHLGFVDLQTASLTFIRIKGCGQRLSR